MKRRPEDRLSKNCRMDGTRGPPFVPGGPVIDSMVYRSRVRTCCGAVFAWANMAMPDCCRICSRVKFITS